MIKAVVCVFLVSLLRLSAQTQPTDEFHHQIGVSGSTISGLGISYQYIFSDNYRVMCTGFYISDGASSDTWPESVIASAGIEGQRTLLKNNTIRLYGLLGLAYFFNGDYRSGKLVYSYNSRKQNTYNGGGGVGMEMIALGRIALHVEVGLVYSFSETKYDPPGGLSSPNPGFKSEVGIGIGGGLGFGFQF